MRWLCPYCSNARLQSCAHAARHSSAFRETLVRYAPRHAVLVNPLEDHIQLRDALFRLRQYSLFLCQCLVTLPQAPFRRPLDKVVLIVT